MHVRNISTISAARKAVNLVLADTELGASPVHYFEPTNLGGLPPTQQESELRAKEDTELGNRTRFATHMCLSSASRALKAGLELISCDVDLPPSERLRVLIEIAASAKAASELAAEAASVLLGHSDPPPDSSFVVSRIKQW
ncbi:hypothetical protein J7E62_18230 [Variovorax paradoxus]|nr:hypothetical protein [Variovorax paradoxus]